VIWLWGATVAIVLVGIVYLLLSFLRRKAPPTLPYQKRTEFMSVEEQVTFRAVEEAISDDYRLFARVRATDVIGVRSGLAQPLWDRAYRKIRTLSLPIVICTRHKLVVTYVVLLAHDNDTPAHRERREFVSQVLEVANIPHVTLRAGAAFSTKQLREHLIAARRRLGVEW
jgi:hypothetical protein